MKVQSNKLFWVALATSGIVFWVVLTDFIATKAARREMLQHRPMAAPILTSPAEPEDEWRMSWETKRGF